VNESSVIEFLKALGCRKIQAQDPDREGKVKVKATCPFERWGHSGGIDSDPSFSIWVNDTGASTYNCFACGEVHGWVWSLPKRLAGMPGNDRRYPEARRILRENEVRKRGREAGDFVATHSKMRKRAAKSVRSKGSRMKTALGTGLPDAAVGVDRVQQSILGEDVEIKRDALDESVLDEFRSEPHPYLRDRGFSLAAWDAWGLMWEENRSGDRIVFPIRDADGRLLAYSRRVTWDKPVCQWCGATSGVRFGSMRKKGDPKSKGGCPRCRNRWIWPKYQHSKGFKRNLLLYGEHMINRDLRKGVVVEGNLDPIRLWQFGVQNAVATLGASPGLGGPDSANGRPAEQLYRLGTIFDDILVIADGDKAGRSMGRIIQDYFHGWPVSVRVEVCPDGRDPGDMEPDDLLDLIGPFGVLVD